MEKVIKVENLGKKYAIGRRQERYIALRDVISDKFKNIFSLRRRADTAKTEEIWALKDVSFEIKQGEVIGVIGKNGAGKTTLLKILSRITYPTTGRAQIMGRVASLLEVGVGFHPELTGRENIFLNGAILGMTKNEIEAEFDEIVSFSELEKFMDTPVKRYSSGMYVRLAFAVAAHLQPEIMLVDEVLAVGDIEFQKKCIGKMEKVAGEGKTVLLVSHNMSTVKALCSRAIFLEQGVMKMMGPVDAAVSRYLNAFKADAAEKIISDEEHLTGTGKIRVRRIQLLNSAANSFTVYWRQPISVTLEIEVYERFEDVAFGAGIRTIDGTHIFHTHQDDEGLQPLWIFEPGRYRIEFTLENNLRPGLYKFHIGADEGHLMIKNLCSLTPVTLEVLGYAQDGSVPEPSNTGLINGRSTWKPPERLA